MSRPPGGSPALSGDLADAVARFLDAPGLRVIVGLGNPYRSDDAAGCAVVRSLLRRLGGSAISPSTIVVDAGNDLLGRLPELEEAAPARLLIVDAADMGLSPGSVRILPEGSLRPSGLSTHENHLPLVLHLLRAANPELRVLVVGIQINIAVPSEGWRLSTAVEEAVEALAEAVAGAILGHSSG